MVIAWARNWQVSWWEWHVLMLSSFLLIAFIARAEWHEERFSALYLDETLAGAQEVSIVLADLAGFTSFSEQHDPDEVAGMLNEYFGRLGPLMERAGGEVHQIVGDEIMVVFAETNARPTTRSARREPDWSSSAQPPGSPTRTRAGRASGSA